MSRAQPHPLTTRLDVFRSPVVRDLAWAILSPTLIVTRDAGHYCSARWFELAFESIAPHLQQLEQDDSPLLQHLNTPASHRLGIYFERLWSYWLQHNERYELLGANVQVPHNGNTLGEFDFIVHDRHADEIEHWELALKFYLGIPPLHVAQHWFGPNLQDRLDMKYQHLQEKQLPLSQTLAGQNTARAHGWNITRRRLISKGRLYYPDSGASPFPDCVDSGHLRGRWMTQTAFHQQTRQQPCTDLKILGKNEWMVSHSRQAGTQDDTLSVMQQNLPYPVQVEVTGPQHLFIVPDDWQQRALQSLSSR